MLRRAVIQLCRAASKPSTQLALRTAKPITAIASSSNAKTRNESHTRYYFMMLPVFAIASCAAAEEESEAEMNTQDAELLIRAKRSLRLDQIDQAVECYRALLRPSSSLSSSQRTVVHIKVAELLYSQHRFAEAYEQYKSAMVLLHDHAQQDNDANWTKMMVEISLYMANCQLSLGHADEADAGYRWCVQTSQHLLASADTLKAEDKDEYVSLAGMSLEEYATFLLTLAEHGPEEVRSEFAEHCVRVSDMARSTAKQLSQPCLRTESRCLSTAAMALQILGQDRKAATIAREMVELCEQEQCPELSAYRAFLHSLKT